MRNFSLSLPVIELMIKHGPELLLGHVGVRVHHLEPAHRPTVEAIRYKYHIFSFNNGVINKNCFLKLNSLTQKTLSITKIFNGECL